MTPKSMVSVDSLCLLLASAAAFTSSKVSMLLKLNPDISFCAVRLLNEADAVVRSLMLGKLCGDDLTSRLSCEAEKHSESGRAEILFLILSTWSLLDHRWLELRLFLANQASLDGNTFAKLCFNIISVPRTELCWASYLVDSSVVI